MATFKCKMCDAILNVREGTKIYVCEYCGTKQEISRGEYDKENESVSMKSLLKRAFMFLEDGKWDQDNIYAEKVLDIDPENAKAYLCKLMADINVHSESELSDPCLDYRNNDNYIKVLRFGDSRLVKDLKAYAIESAYKMALKLMNSAVQEKDYYQAAAQFRSVAGYKYADERALKCDELAKQKKIEKEKEVWKKIDEKKYYSIYELTAVLPVFNIVFAIGSFFATSSAAYIFFIAIVSVVDFLCVYYCSYLYHFIGFDKQNQNVLWGIAVISIIVTSVSIAIIVHVMNIGYKKLNWEDTFWWAFIILSICSLICGLIGDRLGKRKAEKKSYKDD